MFSFPLGIKTKHAVHKKIKCNFFDCFEKQLHIFNDLNHIPKKRSREKKEKGKNKTKKL
jgi:hypothetical protein